MGKSAIIKKVAQSLRVKDGMCPYGHSLMSDREAFDNEKAIAATVRVHGHQGVIYLNPYFGRFEFKCGLELHRGDIVELSCPECGCSLTVDTMCNLCNIPMFAVQLPDGGQVEACPMVGCHKHSLTIVNLDEQLERMYVHETKVQM